MKTSKKRRASSPALQQRLSVLEEKVAQRGIQIHYDLLEAAGLKLKDGICKVNGEYHAYVDRRKSIADKVDILEDYLNHPLPEDGPSDQ